MEIAFLLLISFVAVSSDIAGECDMAAFYLELGCTPVPSADNSTICPESFTCPDLHPDPTKCYYRGLPYPDRSPLPQKMIKNPCSQACSCRISEGEPEFDCAVVDCVESFDSDLKDCVRTYELDSCCSTNNVCGTDAIAALKTCEVDGQTYREGETFLPKNTRKTCICTSDWISPTDSSAYCRDIDCGLEIHYQDKIFDNCAPIFAGIGRTCPIGFECPSTATQVIRGLNLRSVSAQCVFGNQTLAVGDEVTVDEQCTKCVCQVPPFVSCLRQNAC